MRIDGVHHYQHSHQYQDRESMRWIRSLTALSPSLTSWPSSRFSHALSPSGQGLPSGFGNEILWHMYVSTKYVAWRWRQSWVRHKTHNRHQHQHCWCRAGDAAKMEGEWAISPLQFPVYPQNDDRCPKRPPACLLINTNTNTKDHELTYSKIQIPKTQIEIQTCQENFWLIGRCVYFNR